MKGRLLLIFLFALSAASFGQSWPSFGRVADSTNYYEAEPLVDSCISYLRHTLPQDDIAGRIEAVNFLDNWITGVPYVIISQREYLFKATRGNLELMTQHVAGKLYFLRSHPAYPSNSFESEWIGLNWMLDLYNMGAFPQIEAMDELLDMRENNTLREWLMDKVPSDWINENTEE